MKDCVFCHPEKLDIIAENDLALAFHDACPVSRGHCLVIPKRHVEQYFAATAEEHAAMVNLIFNVRQQLEEKFSPDGYNIGSNIGFDAGQTIFHFHIHIIPRYHGDVIDPRGGIRKVIPTRSHHRQYRKDSPLSFEEHTQEP
jgi:diadenosine tetraphosphate (Ap4A) HIT family hydrolase